VSAFRRSIWTRYQNGATSNELSPGLAMKLLAGGAIRDLAEVTGVSVRTVYRWRKDLASVETVTIAGWTATFARRHGKPPVRISAWERG